VLAEIASAHSALSTITLAIQSGKDLSDVAGSCAEYFNTKAVISRNARKHGTKTQLQMFMEREKLLKQEQALKQAMIYSGDPEMWTRWLEFQKECKRERARQAAKKIARNDNELEEVLKYLKYFGGALSTIVTILFTVFEVLERL